MDDILGSAATYVDPMSTRDIVAKIKVVLNGARGQMGHRHIFPKQGNAPKLMKTYTKG